jgi:sulfate transport system permease protein
MAFSLSLPRLREPSVLPGFWPALGFTVSYLSLIVLIPLAALIARPWEHGGAEFLHTVTDPRVLASLRLSFGAAFLASAINLVMGLITAWALVRYDFPGRRLLDAAVDVPFALPTAVAGIALATLYAPNGWIGSLFAPLGVKIAYTPLGVLIALVAVGLPFIVRSVQPVLQDLDAEVEEAARTLGARRWQTIRQVILPAVGEYGSVIFIAGNMPMKSEIAPLLIIIELSQFNYAGAASVGLAMLILSFIALLAINIGQLLFLRRGKR